jgi:transglutaminase-like putative cysteine protease
MICAVGGDDWRPPDTAELALKGPVVEKDADAEALFWEVRVDDAPEGDLIFTHYIRIKVFTDRGRESQSKVDIPFGKIRDSEIKIKDIAARTIKPDGSIVELKKDDVFERTIVKTSGVKVKAKSFAIPAVEAGSLIEYRWREVRVNQSANYIRLEFQRDIPVQRVKYLIKPFPYEGMAMRSITLHGNSTPFAKEKEGFYSTTMTNVPAVHEESRMPPEDQIKTWMLIYYTKDEKLEPEKYWFDFGRRVYENTKSLMKVNDEIKRTAGSVTAGATSDEEKVQRLFDFCRTKIKNVSDDALGLTPAEREKLKANKSPGDTLKRGMGDGADIDLLFAALATATGFDARIVLAPDLGDLFFDKGLPNAYFLEPSNIAVNVGGTWKFFNPGFNYVPFGMLRWQEEGEPSLITDPKQPVWVTTPLSPPERSQIKRRAKLRLDQDGTLEGDVTLEFTGHFGIERKEENDEESETQREETLREEMKSQISTAEITKIKVENVNDYTKPFAYSYHLRVPGYAQRTGKRIFLQPAVFQHGIGPLFVTSERKYPIYFHYPWSEDDEVNIELPAGYALDNADAPAPFTGGQISEYKPSLAVTKDGKVLIYKRSFFFGGGGMILFQVGTYNQLKNFFDTLHKQDNHTVALKQIAASQ